MINKTFVAKAVISISLLCANQSILANDNILFGIINDVAQATNQLAKGIIGEPEPKVKHVTTHKKYIESSPQKSHRSHHQAKVKAQSIPVKQEVNQPQPIAKPKTEELSIQQPTPNVQETTPDVNPTVSPKTSEPVPQATNLPVVSEPQADKPKTSSMTQ
jgi:hypothetical protein